MIGGLDVTPELQPQPDLAVAAEQNRVKGVGHHDSACRHVVWQTSSVIAVLELSGVREKLSPQSFLVVVRRGPLL